jgi:DNA-binding MarR family transcriptional regulator
MTAKQVVVPADILEPLEMLMFGAIGLTTLALSGASAGDLTLFQWRALVVIGRSGSARVGDIASAVGMSLSSASRLVRRMEGRGLVWTERDRADRRATLVRLTAAGTALRADVVNRRRSLMEAALSRRSATLPDKLGPGLHAIAQAFEAAD